MIMKELKNTLLFILPFLIKYSRNWDFFLFPCIHHGVISFAVPNRKDRSSLCSAFFSIRRSMGPLLVQIPTANFSLVDLACDVCRLQKAHFLRWKIAIPPHKCAGCHRHLQGASRIRFSFTTEAHLIHHRAAIYFTQIGWDAHADMKRKIKAELKKRRALSFLVPPYNCAQAKRREHIYNIQKTKGGKTAPSSTTVKREM